MSRVLAPVIGTLRAPFLALTPACVLLGIATAAHADRAVDVIHAWLALFGALSAHVSVNTFNEYLYAALVGAVAARVLPAGALLGLATLPLSAIASLGAVRHADRVERLGNAMRLNVLVSLLKPVSMAVGLMLG